MNWNVISAGPSREHLKQSDLLPDCPVVTVNRAIDVMDRGIHVDFAMFADPPHHLAEIIDLKKYLQPPIQLWCPRATVTPDMGVMQFRDSVSMWEPFLPSSVGIRTTPFGTVKDEVAGGTRYLFALLCTLERCLMFRPEKVRILCADMMGSWAPGLTEDECEMQQSLMEQARGQISRYQKQLNASKGKDKAAEIQLQNVQAMFNDLQQKGDPMRFKRWKYERMHLDKLQKKAEGVGIEFEWKTPSAVVMA